ncbi:chemotaxis protein CheW [Nitrogeniibacter mangrovi]|uniref:Chemotaxis protein CheW n=1 Tax=Nitrogeniibacter mangrovi TaxID=2016596 RepID=A0A6C1B651_9RHOO|nr:chemotaxis protein CheW [Nitrogeniibacter mangrovi]QID18275.1 chemotaxis protein CheW [Nitrogeniibacter mangrovi]
MLQQLNAASAMARVEGVDEGAVAQEFLTFTLGEEEYAIDILRVQEIRGYDAVTRIANTPSFIKGVINLRGTIVPILDLRIKFSLGDVTYNEFTVVIILSVGERVVGVVVDSVSDVITLDAEQIKPAPQFSSAMDSGHIRGIGTMDERMLILIDIERLLLSPELGLTDRAVQ